jgi:hypothetical protein
MVAVCDGTDAGAATNAGIAPYEGRDCEFGNSVLLSVSWRWVYIPPTAMDPTPLGTLKQRPQAGTGASQGQLISNGQWTVDLSQCIKPLASDLGHSYEVVFLVDHQPPANQFWQPAVV